MMKLSRKTDEQPATPTIAPAPPTTQEQINALSAELAAHDAQIAELQQTLAASETEIDRLAAAVAAGNPEATRAATRVKGAWLETSTRLDAITITRDRVRAQINELLPIRQAEIRADQRRALEARVAEVETSGVVAIEDFFAAYAATLDAGARMMAAWEDLSTPELLTDGGAVARQHMATVHRDALRTLSAKYHGFEHIPRHLFDLVKAGIIG